MSHPPQQIRFCTSRDGVRIAYATCGSGPPLVRPAHFLSHLELDWHNPVWGPWLDLLARRHTLIRYDLRGCGLSDREGIEFSFDKLIEDLEAVVEATGTERFGIVGMDGGAATALAYAVRHPARVSHLAAFGCWAKGRFARSRTTQEREITETDLKAIELGWAHTNPAFRQLFTSLLLPNASGEQLHAFNEHIRVTTTPANAASFLRVIYQTNPGEIAARVRCPVLVLHSRQDERVPFEEGRSLAGLIADARFVPLESRNHILLETEPAWQQMAAALDAFFPKSPPAGPDISELTGRELQVLELVAQGIDNARIAERLGMSEKTARNHVSAILGKLRISRRSEAIVRAREAGFGRGSPRLN
jgi:pimeloyl-ACP methyl ester carboxylesterase/DNA-binding CsgD family transcriptional regulator